MVYFYRIFFLIRTYDPQYGHFEVCASLFLNHANKTKNNILIDKNMPIKCDCTVKWDRRLTTQFAGDTPVYDRVHRKSKLTT